MTCCPINYHPGPSASRFTWRIVYIFWINFCSEKYAWAMIPAPSKAPNIYFLRLSDWLMTVSFSLSGCLAGFTNHHLPRIHLYKRATACSRIVTVHWIFVVKLKWSVARRILSSIVFWGEGDVIFYTSGALPELRENLIEMCGTTFFDPPRIPIQSPGCCGLYFSLCSFNIFR